MDPGRPSNAEASELERRLLELARQDRIPAGLSSRMAEGIGVHMAGAALHGGVAAGTRLGMPLFAKTGLWGVLTLALVGAVSWYVAPAAPRAARGTQHDQDTSAPANEALAAVEAPAPTAAPSANAVVVAAPIEAAMATPARVRTAAAPSEDDALRAEVALLDRARDALHQNAAAHALRLLDQHQRRFARAQLEPEAAALRIEALVQLGSYAQAETLSQRFVSAYPQHPLSEHVAKLTAARANAAR